MRLFMVGLFVIAGVTLILAPLQYDFMVRDSILAHPVPEGTPSVAQEMFLQTEYLWSCFAVGVGSLFAGLCVALCPRRDENSI